VDDLAVHDEPVADARADRDDRETGDAAAEPEPALGLGERDDVVLERDGDADLLFEERAEGHVLPPEEGREFDGGSSHGAAERDADPREALGAELVDDGAELGGDDGGRGGFERSRRGVDEGCSHVGRHDVQRLARDLDADEPAEARRDVERPHRTADRAVGGVVELDEQAAIEEGLREPREARRRQAEARRESAARDRSVNEHGSREGFLAVGQHPVVPVHSFHPGTNDLVLPGVSRENYFLSR
jgi:hypothetical protein